MLSRQKVKEYILLAYAHVSRLRDVRFAGQILFVVIVLLVSWSGVKAIDSNYSLEKQISTLQQKITVQQLENNNLKLQNQYYNSDQYLELSARQNFGLAAPGEKEIIVSKGVALSYTVPEPKVAPPKLRAQLPFYERNLQAWVDFFLHRQPPAD
jgi:cell division protein FtsL